MTIAGLRGPIPLLHGNNFHLAMSTLYKYILEACMSQYLWCLLLSLFLCFTLQIFNKHIEIKKRWPIKLLSYSVDREYNLGGESCHSENILPMYSLYEYMLVWRWSEYIPYVFSEKYGTGLGRDLNYILCWILYRLCTLFVIGSQIKCILWRA